MLHCCLESILINNVFYFFLDGEETTVKEHDYEYIPQTASLYKLHLKPKKIQDAKVICEDEGAILYYPDTENNLSTMMSFFKNKYKEAFPNNLLLGLEKAENEFKTIDGKLKYITVR